MPWFAVVSVTEITAPAAAIAGVVNDDTTRSPPIEIVRGDVLLLSSASVT